MILLWRSAIKGIRAFIRGHTSTRRKDKNEQRGYVLMRGLKVRLTGVDVDCQRP